MNPDTMTLTELRDWHAREDGCVFVPHRIFSDCPDLGKWIRNGRALEQHPFPATLDGAASAMPKGWDWERWQLDWVGYPLDNKERFVTVSRTDCKTTDLYRLGMKARLAEKELKHGN